MGAVLIYKTDSHGTALSGAQFKIATSKENAKNGIFVKDKSGNDIISTSDQNGYVIFSGLKYGQNNQGSHDASSSYWIVEVQSPSYVENGETKYYNLLSKPVEVKVDSTSQIYSEDDTTIVVNEKPFTLPFTGGTLVAVLLPTILGILIIIGSYIAIRKNKSKSNAHL